MKKSDLQEHQLSNSSANEHKIVVKTKAVSHILNVNDITHLVCDCYLTTIYAKSGEEYVVSKLLKDFESELEDYGFVRVNRNTLVNIVHVVSFANGRNRIVHLSNSASFVISRRGMGRLREYIEIHQSEKRTAY